MGVGDVEGIDTEMTGSAQAADTPPHAPTVVGTVTLRRERRHLVNISGGIDQIFEYKI